MQETWKSLSDYNGLIEVSDLGKVRKVQGKAAMLKPRLDKGGYLYVHIRISKLGIDRMVKIHRLVAKAFIPNPDNLPMVNHKDENKTNNCVSNLEWCTNKYNLSYGTARQRIFETIERNGGYKVRPIIQKDSEGNIIREWNSATEAAKELKIDCSRILAACHKSYKGFVWDFKEKDCLE